jgi:hypothetical protein
MKSTKPSTTTCAYLGCDVTDRFSKAARVMDVCGLRVEGNGLAAHFWTWSWGQSSHLSLTALLPEVHASRSLMLDAPQGLAQIGRTIRDSERKLRAAGKTGATRPPLTQVYGGFISSSLDLFAAFHAAGLAISPASLRGLCEVYPAAIWRRLARRLPNKHLAVGRAARVVIMRALGVVLPDALTHDQLDACAAALLGAAADGRIPGVSVVAIGEPVWWDATHECLREGPILVPDVDPTVLIRLEALLRPLTSMLPPRRQRTSRPRVRLATKLNPSSRAVVARPILAGVTRQDRAADLFERLVGELMKGRPTLCTYKGAVASILGYPKFTPAYCAQLLKLATAGPGVELDGLGEIHLDTFLVNQKYRPGDKHWEHATYRQAEWNRMFFGAVIIE